MSELHFSCPACGQRLSVDSVNAGRQVTCPSCQRQVVVPGAGGPPPPMGAGASSGAVPPPLGGSVQPPPLPAAARPAVGRTSGLAIASLVCSAGSFLMIPLGFIPGIICGHLARRRLAENPVLGGRGVAKAGLIIGYISLGLHVLVVIGVAAFFLVVGRQVHRVSSRTPPRNEMQPVPAQNESAAENKNEPEENSADTTEDGTGWTLKLDNVSIPDEPVSGRIHGQEFTAEKVELQGNWLKFRQGKELFADLEVDVVLFGNPAEFPGKSWKVPAPQRYMAKPHIWMYWKSGSARQQKTWMDKYALRLEFGEKANGEIPGKIYLCLPDAEKSFVRGTFEVRAAR